MMQRRKVIPTIEQNWKLKQIKSLNDEDEDDNDNDLLQLNTNDKSLKHGDDD